ncbi:unnamed protein product [Arctia plantaginis]|uniref:Uncharacterized protein n=1 Tax=Arctia plantaginis TaxID=874455 RepID=A0A8S1A0F7_ARCPL|nr:unnamed protein product [Arctia plantaginis]
MYALKSVDVNTGGYELFELTKLRVKTRELKKNYGWIRCVLFTTYRRRVFAADVDDCEAENESAVENKTSDDDENENDFDKDDVPHANLEKKN